MWTLITIHTLIKIPYNIWLFTQPNNKTIIAQLHTTTKVRQDCNTKQHDATKQKRNKSLINVQLNRKARDSMGLPNTIFNCKCYLLPPESLGLITFLHAFLAWKSDIISSLSSGSKYLWNVHNIIICLAVGQKDVFVLWKPYMIEQ